MKLYEKIEVTLPFLFVAGYGLQSVRLRSWNSRTVNPLTGVLLRTTKRLFFLLYYEFVGSFPFAVGVYIVNEDINLT